MNFIKQIIDAGFVEQGQKQLKELRPGNKHIPEWWVNYPYDKHWFGVSIDHPDAWFRKENVDAELSISLQGHQILHPKNYEEQILLKNISAKIILINIENKVIYRTMAGIIPPKEIIDKL